LLRAGILELYGGLLVLARSFQFDDGTDAEALVLDDGAFMKKPIPLSSP
jgi:hypothetical protein